MSKKAKGVKLTSLSFIYIPVVFLEIADDVVWTRDPRVSYQYLPTKFLIKFWC